MPRPARKPSNCPCPGSWRQKRPRWVLLEPPAEPGASAHVKCLDCGWKWRTAARYAATLERWKERRRSGLTDQEILSRLEECSLVVNIRTARVYGRGRNQEWKELTVIERSPPGHTGTYRFVSICANGRKKKISLHRLVWMAANMRLVPDGFDVDHRNGTAVGDGIDNLCLLPSKINRANTDDRHQYAY